MIADSRNYRIDFDKRRLIRSVKQVGEKEGGKNKTAQRHFIMTLRSYITKRRLLLFCAQTFYRVGNGSFYALVTHREQSNENRKNASQRKHPPFDGDAVGIG